MDTIFFRIKLNLTILIPYFICLISLFLIFDMIIFNIFTIKKEAMKTDTRKPLWQINSNTMDQRDQRSSIK